MTESERTYLDGIDRIAEIEKSFSDITLMLEDNHRLIQALSNRTEGQYEMLSKRLDRAAEEVLKLKTRLKKLEEDKSDGAPGD